MATAVNFEGSVIVVWHRRITPRVLTEGGLKSHPVSVQYAGGVVCLERPNDWSGDSKGHKNVHEVQHGSTS